MAFGLSDLQYLMHQLGPAIPEIVTIIQEDIDSWQIEFDEGVSIQLSWQPQPPRALLSCAIGRPDDTRREAVYAALLNANLLLTGVAGLKLALSEPDQEVLLIGDYDSDEGTLDGLKKCVAEFLNFAARFAHMVSEPVTCDDHDRPTDGIGSHCV